jgi:hypothetical protein
MKSTSVHSLRCCVMWMCARSVDRGSAPQYAIPTAPRGGCARRDRPRRLRFASLCVTYTAVIYICVCVIASRSDTPACIAPPPSARARQRGARWVGVRTLSDDSVHSTQTRPPRLPSRASPQDSLYATIRPRAVHSNTERFHDRPIGSVKRQLASNVAHGRGAVEAKAAALDLARLRLALQ